jgi:hypothetical protein
MDSPRDRGPKAPEAIADAPADEVRGRGPTEGSGDAPGTVDGPAAKGDDDDLPF